MTPIETTFTSGAVLYAILHNPDGTVWNDLNQAWEVESDAAFAQYAIPLTEQGASGYYSAPYPPAITDVLTTEAIYNQSGGAPAVADAPAIGIAQSQGSNMAAIGNSVAALLNFMASAGAIVRGSAIAGTLSTTQATTGLASVVVDAFVGRVILWTSGAAVNQASNITAYDGAGLLTFAPLSVAPGASDTFIIL